VKNVHKLLRAIHCEASAGITTPNTFHTSQTFTHSSAPSMLHKHEAFTHSEIINMWNIPSLLTAIHYKVSAGMSAPNTHKTIHSFWHDSPLRPIHYEYTHT